MAQGRPALGRGGRSALRPLSGAGQPPADRTDPGERAAPRRQRAPGRTRHREHPDSATRRQGFRPSAKSCWPRLPHGGPGGTSTALAWWGRGGVSNGRLRRAPRVRRGWTCDRTRYNTPRDWPRTSRVVFAGGFLTVDALSEPELTHPLQGQHNVWNLMLRVLAECDGGLFDTICRDVGSCEEGAQVIFAEKASLASPTGGEHDRVGGVLSPDVDVPHFVSHQTLRSTRLWRCCFGYRRCPRFVPSGFDFRHCSCHRLQRGRRTNTQSRKIVPTKMRISITTSMSNAYALRSGWSPGCAATGRRTPRGTVRDRRKGLVRRYPSRDRPNQWKEPPGDPWLPRGCELGADPLSIEAPH